MTSDEFFQSEFGKATHDIIFIDGLHTFEQVIKDFSHASLRLANGGIILIDDVIPSDCFSTLEDPQLAIHLREKYFNIRSGAWHGTTFRIIPHINQFYLDFDYMTLVKGAFSDGDALTIAYRKTSRKHTRSVCHHRININNFHYTDIFALLEIYNVANVDGFSASDYRHLISGLGLSAEHRQKRCQYDKH
jgi:hypothetical protein